jgi:hypothetical protein
MSYPGPCPGCAGQITRTSSACGPEHYRVKESRQVTRIKSYRSGSQLLTAPEDRPGQATMCIVFAALRYAGQRGPIDDDVTDDTLGQRRGVASQQRLPVQRSGVTAVKVGVLAAG